MDLLQRVKDILLRPNEMWPVLRSEEAGIAAIYKSHVIMMAAVPAVAQAIGLMLIGTSFLGVRHRPSITSTLGNAGLSYCVSLAAVYIVALVINGLAPKFESRKNLTRSFTLVAYSWTPAWAAGPLLLIPSLDWLAKLISFYGFYLFYTGLPVFMEAPRDKVNVYFLCAIVLSAILVGFIFSILALVI
jgi:hypothetical protein